MEGARQACIVASRSYERPKTPAGLAPRPASAARAPAPRGPEQCARLPAARTPLLRLRPPRAGTGPPVHDTCARCMSLWIRDGAAAGDSAAALGGPRPPLLPLVAGAESAEAAQVAGLGSLCSAARLPPAACTALLQELLALGAVDVKELSLQDWRSLATWAQIKAARAAAAASELVPMRGAPSSRPR